MTELDISKDFTIDDIHKIREYNWEQTKNLRKKNRASITEKKPTPFFLKRA